MFDTSNKQRAGELSAIADRLHQHAQLAAAVIVVVGCCLILYPFVPAILFAAVVCSATWPLYVRVRTALWGRSALAALAMSLLLVGLVIAPTLLLAAHSTDYVKTLLETSKTLINGGPIEPPVWIRDIPWIGGLLADYWQRLAASGDSLATQWKGLLEPARNFLMGAGRVAGEGVLQLALASFIGFFFYRDGEQLVLTVSKALEKIAGDLGIQILETIDNTITGVIHGIFGTALAQALVALAGFVIAGVPAAFLLAAATFFLSIVPIGPPLIWGGAAVWLAYDGQFGWAVFVALWGILAISSIDNFVKPYLISRSSKLPLLLIVLGMFGGIAAFGLVGLFIGPPVLAIGVTLVRLWTSHRSIENLAIERVVTTVPQSADHPT